jgi:hypothetical protein
VDRRPQIATDGTVTPSEHVRCRVFDDDLVILDLKGGEYYALNAVGARMWSLLTTGNTPAQVGATLANEYDVPEPEVVQDCTRLVGELIARGLLIMERR